MKLGQRSDGSPRYHSGRFAGPREPSKRPRVCFVGLGGLALASALIAVLSASGTAAAEGGNLAKKQIEHVTDRYNKAILQQKPLILCEGVLPPSTVPSTKRCSHTIRTTMSEPDSELVGRANTFDLRSVEVSGNYAAGRAVPGDGRRSTAEYTRERSRWWLRVFDRTTA